MRKDRQSIYDANVKRIMDDGKGELLTSHQGAYCDRCGRTVTEAEYSAGATWCCGRGVIDESV